MAKRYIRAKLSEFLVNNPLSASIIDALEDSYKEAVAEVTQVIADSCAGNDVYKGAIKVSLKVLGYVNKEIEKAEKKGEQREQ